MTSSSSYGISQITLQFNLNRDIDAAAQDVQSAINAAGSTLPRNLPYPPTYAKVNPADAPIVTLALTSDTIPLRTAVRPRRHADGAAPELGAGRRPRLGRGRHQAGRAHPGRSVAARLLRPQHGRPAHRHRRRQRLRPQGLARRRATSPTPSPPTTRSPAPRPTSPSSSPTATTRRCCSRTWPRSSTSLENTKVGGWYQDTPAVIIDVHRQPGANVIETVQRIKAELPRLQRAMPSGAKLTIVHDRTGTIRASVHDVQFTLVLSVALVVLVVLLFLRTIRATIIAGVALPVSLIATFGVMWFCGFSPRQPVADGADHRHRLRRRRRHRHDREHRAPHRGGREPDARRRSRARARSASRSSR